MAKYLIFGSILVIILPIYLKYYIIYYNKNGVGGKYEVR